MTLDVTVSSVAHGGPDSGCCRFCDPSYIHPSGLIIADDDDAAVLASNPTTMTFTTIDGDAGDIGLDGHDFGWYDLADADRVAAFFNITDYTTITTAAYSPRNPRRNA